MAIELGKVNVTDLTENNFKVLGIGINRRSDINGIFPVNYTTLSQAKDNLRNLILTRKGERLMQPEFGCDVWKTLFEPYLIQSFELGGSGADISPLNNGNNVLAGLRPDSQRYFDYHHAANDTFDKVNKRELEMGAAAMTGIIYLMDKYGTDFTN